MKQYTKPFRANIVPFIIILLPCFLVAVSIIYRFKFRSIYYPGWDTLGAANGQFLIATRGVFSAIIEVWCKTRHFQYWNHTNSVLFSIVPGWLTLKMPWQYWTSMLSLFVGVVSFWLLGRSCGLRKTQWAPFLLGICCSPAILSFSIAGYPYLSGCLPHALALWLMLSYRSRFCWWKVLLIGLLIIEISWHVYELGKTVCFVFFLGVFLLPKIPVRVRAVWFGLFLLGAFLIVQTQGTNVSDNLNGSQTLPELIYTSLANVVKVFSETGRLDLPILACVGLLGLIFVKQNRFFFAAALLMQWALVLMLSSRGIYELRSRRILVLEFYNLAILACWIREWVASKRLNKVTVFLKGVLIMVLFAGTVWQMIELVCFFRVPVDKRNRCLPYTISSADYYIDADEIQFVNMLADKARKGHHILFVYNYDSYRENTTDPLGLPERLYLELGHKDFIDSVTIFGSALSRYSQVPIVPLMFMDSYVSAKFPRPFSKVLVFVRHKDISKDFLQEASQIVEAIEKHVDLSISAEQPHEDYTLYRIKGSKEQGCKAHDYFPKGVRGVYFKNTNFSGERRVFSPRARHVGFIWSDSVDSWQEAMGIFYVKPWNAFALRIDTQLSIPVSGEYDLCVGSDDGSRIIIDDKVLIDNWGHHAHIEKSVTNYFEAGLHKCVIEYYNAGGPASLTWKIDLKR